MAPVYTFKSDNRTHYVTFENGKAVSDTFYYLDTPDNKFYVSSESVIERHADKLKDQYVSKYAYNKRRYSIPVMIEEIIDLSDLKGEIYKNFSAQYESEDLIITSGAITIREPERKKYYSITVSDKKYFQKTIQLQNLINEKKEKAPQQIYYERSLAAEVEINMTFRYKGKVYKNTKMFLTGGAPDSKIFTFRTELYKNLVIPKTDIAKVNWPTIEDATKALIKNRQEKEAKIAKEKAIAENLAREKEEAG